MSSSNEIRNSTYNLLKQANIAGGKVFNSKVTPTFLTNTPAVLVYTNSMSSQQLTSSVRPAFISTVQLQIDIIVSMSETWADDADSLVDQIINTLMTDADWIAQFTVIDEVRAEYSFLGDMQQPLGMVSMTLSGKVFKAFTY